MITFRVPRPQVLFLALVCAYAPIKPTPAMAVSMLTADVTGFAAAGSDVGAPDKLITPGDGSLAVTFGAAASSSPPVTEGSIALSASALAGGEARYGALAGRARAEAASLPPSPYFVGAEARPFLRFLD